MSTVKKILDVKGTTFWFVSPEERVDRAVAVLLEKKIGAVLVMDGERLEGIFSERDYLRLAGTSTDRTVGEVMTRPVYTVAPSTSVDECMALMTDRRIRHLPVQDRGEIIGIVSIGDVVKELIADREITIRGLENYIVGRELPT